MTMQDINVDYSTTIPNNVGLTEDRRVLKALEVWHPGYLNWWNDMGPEGFQEKLVYLRTAYSVDPRGWAKFDYVRMPEYRDRKSTRLNSSHRSLSRMPSSA